jgi:hypothetical protein
MKFIMLSILTAISISQAIAAPDSDANDTVRVTSDKKVNGPGGVITSCTGIARFDMIQNRRGVAGGSSDVYDGPKNKKQIFSADKKFFDVKYQDWTPEIVEFLKSTVDKCVAERHSLRNLFLEKSDGYTELSPSSAKQLIDDIYAISLATKKFQEDQVEQQKQFSLQKQNQEAERQEKINQDESRGYNRMSFTDFQLDAKSMQAGKRLSITGFYEVFGHLQSLTENPSQIQMPAACKLFLLSEDAPRDARRQLIDLQNKACGKYLICQITVLGHVQRCSETMLGKKVRDTICVAVDDIRIP